MKSSVLHSAERKLAAIQRISNLDEDELDLVEQLLEILKESMYAGIPPMPPRTIDEINADYEEAFRDVHEGRTYPHEVVVAYFKQRYRI